MRQNISVRNMSNSTVVQGRGVTTVGKYLVDTKERRVYIGNAYLEFHPKMKGELIVVAGDHIIIDGYKMVGREWVNLSKVNNPWNKIKSWFRRK